MELGTSDKEGSLIKYAPTKATLDFTNVDPGDLTWASWRPRFARVTLSPCW